MHGADSAESLVLHLVQILAVGRVSLIYSLDAVENSGYIQRRRGVPIEPALKIDVQPHVQLTHPRTLLSAGVSQRGNQSASIE